jgi:2,7-dihydroxy-5-methyl-1-naphthoate 7-O-methyltransferase
LLENLTGRNMTNLIETLSDLCTPWCLHVAATLRIADAVNAGVDEIDQLAASTGSDAYALHRVLTHLVSKGVFEEPAPGQFALNEAARGLLDPVTRLSLDLEGLGGRMAAAWGTLPAYVRTGAPAYQAIFGLPFWEDLAAHPDIAADFDALIGPAGHGVPEPDFQISGGWDSVRIVVDVGGGTGAMLAEILRLYPNIQGILVDQPRTVARSDDIFQAAGVSGRVRTVGQSFFEPLPTGGDLYLLRGVINDWPDRDAVTILKRCAEAARPLGRVVVLKGMTEDDAPRGVMIEMVLLGGKVRSESEFRELATEAGLEIVTAGEQASGYFVVECRLP